LRLLKARRAGIFVVGKLKTAKAPWERNLLAKNMPPRRGWGIFGLGFYKDVAPTALKHQKTLATLFDMRANPKTPHTPQTK
jgi:hypothetical protein